MQKGQRTGNSMLQNGLTECPKARTSWCVCVQGNKGRPACWAVMDRGRIVEGEL